MAANSSQYLVVLGVVLVIAVVAISLLSFFPISAPQTSGPVAAAAGNPFSVTEISKKANSLTTSIVLQNNAPEKKTLEEIIATKDGVRYRTYFAALPFEPGEKRAIQNLNLPPTSDGESYAVSFDFIYDSGTQSTQDIGGITGPGEPYCSGVRQSCGNMTCCSGLLCTGGLSCLISIGPCSSDSECVSGNCRFGFCSGNPPGSCEPLCARGSPTTVCQETLGGCNSSWEAEHPRCYVSSSCRGDYDACALYCGGTTCRSSGEACLFPTDCCTGVCNGVCSCADSGQFCTSDAECCGGLSCNNYECGACLRNSQQCSDDSDCCQLPSEQICAYSELAHDSVCQSCLEYGASCTGQGRECCGSYTCIEGQCLSPISCTVQGGECQNDSDCCHQQGSPLFCNSGICDLSCSRIDEGCGNGVSCCSGLVCELLENGTETCAPCLGQGENCTQSGACCTGLLCAQNGAAANTCSSCVNASGNCTSTDQCCSGTCSGGICSSCSQDGANCTAGSDCCSGFCNADGACAQNASVQLPDLVALAADSIGFSLPHTIGVPFNVQIETVNTGNGTAGPSYTAITFTNPANATGAQHGGIVVPELAPGGNYGSPFGLMCADNGTYELSVVADASGTVNESNESNAATYEVNCARAEINGTNQSLPDLVTFSHEAELSGAHYLGVPFNISIDTQNHGNGTAPPTTTRAVFGGAAVDFAIPQIEVGSGVNSSLELNCTYSGHALLEIIADASGTANESDESNNVWDYSVDCIAPVPPDLHSYIPDDALNAHHYVSLPFTLPVITENTGGSPAGPTMTWVFSSMLFDDVVNVSALAPGENYTGHVNLTCNSPGTYNIYLYADANEEINESNETNNEAMFALNCTLLPNMYVTVAGLNQYMGLPKPVGVPFNITVTTRTSGAYPGNSSTTTVTMGDFFAQDISVPDGISSYARNVSVTCNRSGLFQLNVTADAHNEVFESNENDNSQNYSIWCGQPDLIPSSQDLAGPRTYGIVFGSLNIGTYATYSVTNAGDAPSAPSRLNGTIIPDDGGFDMTQLVPYGYNIPALMPGEAYTLSDQMVVCRRQANFTVTLNADSANGVPESNETNNAAPYVVECVRGADIEAYITPDLPNMSYQLNTPLERTVVTWNNGIFTTQNSTITMVEMGGEAIANITVPAIGIEEPSFLSNMTNITITCRLPGNFPVTVTADATHNVSETNEDNNVVEYPMRCVNGMPDLYPRAVYYGSSPNHIVGYLFNLTLSTWNNGTASSANPSTTRVDFDGGTVLTPRQYSNWPDVWAANRNISVPVIEAGSRDVQDFTLNCTSAGMKTVTITADTENAVNESNKANNVKSYTVACAAGQPDLVVNATASQLSGKKPIGVPFTVSVSTRNNGTAPAGASATRVEFGGAAVADIQVPPLETSNMDGSMNTSIVSATCIQNGTFNFTIRADYANNVDESGENDNVWTSAVNCSSDYNLTISLNDSNAGVLDPLLFNYSLNSSVPMQPVSFLWNLGLPSCYDGILANGSLYNGANMTGAPHPAVRYLCPAVDAYGMQHASLAMQVRLADGTVQTIFSNIIPLNISFCSRPGCPYESYGDVLLVVNNNSATSRAIGDYYVARRGVSHVVRLTNVTTYYTDMSGSDADLNIRLPILNYIRQNGLDGKINYIVLAKDIPVSIKCPDYYGLDSFLVDPSNPMCNAARTSNPYYNPSYGQTPVFSSAKQGGKYLVTRLAGLTQAASMALVDRAFGSRDVGNFEFDKASGAQDSERLDGYADVAIARLSQMGVDSSRFILDNTSSTYLYNQPNVLMYASWGSNDYRSRYPMGVWNYQYARPNNTWAAGAVAETYVSTSGRTFTDCPPLTPDGLKPNYYGFDSLSSPRTLPAGTVLSYAAWPDGRADWWLCGSVLQNDTNMLAGTRMWNYTKQQQSLIADWVEDGVAGAKGYTNEPYSSAMSHVDVLFPRYYQGYSFADSFYSSSAYIHWMDIYPGDPKGRLNGAAIVPVCRQDGASCSALAQCCSGQCSGGACGAPTCVADGLLCSLPTQCCSGLCNGGLCGAPSAFDIYPSAVIGDAPRPVGSQSAVTIRTISTGHPAPPASVTNVSFAGIQVASFATGAYNCVYSGMCIYDYAMNITCPAYENYNLTIAVDANSSIYEYNETNNALSFNVPCGMLPDLAANVTPLAPILANQTDQTDFVVNVSTNNLGPAGALTSKTLVSFAGQNVTNITVYYQPPGSSYGENVTLRCPGVGNYTLSLTADFERAVNETDETNNQRNYTIRCEPASYVITVNANDTSPDVLDRVYLSYTITPYVAPQYINVTWNFGPWDCYDGVLANGSLNDGAGMNTSQNATIRFLCPTLPEYGGPIPVYLTAKIGLPSQPTKIVGSQQLPVAVSFCSHPGCPYESYDDVLLVATALSPDSLAIRDYYATQRGVGHVLTLTNVSPTYNEMTASYTDSDIRTPIYNYLQQNNLAGKINYIVLTKDFPIRIKCPATYSLDASLMPLTSTVCSSHPATPAYYKTAYTYAPVYSAAKFGSPLVTRLSGWSRADAMAQVDRAYGDKSSGNFVFDKCIPSNGGACAQGGLQYINTNMDTAMSRLSAMGVSPSRFAVDDGSTYFFNQPNVLMYVSWGFNDVHSRDTLSEWNAHYASPGNSWKSGSVGEYYYSYSALNSVYNIDNYYLRGSLDHDVALPAGTLISWGSYRLPAPTYAYYPNGTLLSADTTMLNKSEFWNYSIPWGGYSMDMVHEGLASTMGEVNEPYAATMPEVDVMFPRYYQGYNYADSSYSSSFRARWQEIYMGDPKGRLH